MSEDWGFHKKQVSEIRDPLIRIKTHYLRIKPGFACFASSPIFSILVIPVTQCLFRRGLLETSVRFTGLSPILQ